MVSQLQDNAIGDDSRRSMGEWVNVAVGKKWRSMYLMTRLNIKKL